MDVRTLNLPRPGSSTSGDRVFLQKHGDVLWFALADGAGGQSGGAEAAARVCEAISRAASSSLPDPYVLQERLTTLDQQLASEPATGLSTAVVGAIEGPRLVGCSVGDSELWLVQPDRHEVVTRRQYRRPLLGSGEAMPVVFKVEVPAGARLLVASDGLFGAAREEDVLAACRRPDPGAALAVLQGLQAQDDLSVILAQS